MDMLTKFLSYFFTDKKMSGFMLEPSTPEIINCNKFIVRFCKSGVAQIEVSESAINTNQTNLFGDLAGIPYTFVRNRVRVISNLDPIHNKTEETGRFKLSYSNDGPMIDVELLSIFSTDITRFTIKKIEATVPTRP